MMKECSVVCFVFCIGFVSAVSANFDCPESVGVNEEFECSLEVTEGEGVYDVKLEIMQDTENVGRVWNEVEEKWKSSFYYVKDFISSGETKELRVKVEMEGNYECVLKLRQGDTKEFFDFSLNVGEGSVSEGGEVEESGEGAVEEGEEGVEESEEDRVEEDEEKVAEDRSENIVLNSEEREIISLNSPEIVEEESFEVVYESKSFKALKYAPYAFSIFLIVVVGFLLWDRK